MIPHAQTALSQESQDMFGATQDAQDATVMPPGHPPAAPITPPPAKTDKSYSFNMPSPIRPRLRPSLTKRIARYQLGTSKPSTSTQIPFGGDVVGGPLVSPRKSFRKGTGKAQSPMIGPSRRSLRPPPPADEDIYMHEVSYYPFSPTLRNLLHELVFRLTLRLPHREAAQRKAQELVQTNPMRSLQK